MGEGAVKKAGAEVFDTAKALYEGLWSRAKDDEATQAALAQAASEPESVGYQQVLQEKLVALLEADVLLAQRLAQILSEAHLLSEGRSLSSDRSIAVGGSVSGSQFFTGDHNKVTINNMAAPLPERTGEVSNVPGGGSQTFVGRDDALKTLHKRLLSERETDQTANRAVAITAIQGMGGIGKTELARQYAQQYAASYPDGRCWLQARDLNVASQIVAFAKVHFRIELPDGLELSEQVAHCWKFWPGDERVLVVYDDVTDYERVEAVLPPSEAERFVVLMTTRRQNLAVTVESFEIEVLSETAALELLRQIVGITRTDVELETAQAICEWVGYLPLALELIGQYLRQKPEVSY
ncbi:MAG: NB-ARC domain-containing protein, partial [Cyanobacteria bacterium J06632_3]